MQLAADSPPFVLVANDVEGRWDVYATRFDRALASFDERQQACRYASSLAATLKNGLVLLRENNRRAADISVTPAPR
jgi:hypothetical protein